MAGEYIQMRKLGIEKYLKQEQKITRICRELSVSRKWFYKWYNRYLNDEKDWCLDRSRARKTSNRVLDESTEKQIVQVRKKLEKIKYAQVGAVAIMYQLKQQGVKQIPTVCQINRTLKRYDMVKPKGRYKSKHKPYPKIQVTKPGEKYDMDFTPSYIIKGRCSTRALNIIDANSRRVKVNICTSRRGNEVINAMIRTWQIMGVPKYLQMDNDPSFSSHNLHPRKLSKVIRFMLSLKIQPIYIPEYQPWWNGIVEKFNESYKNFFMSQRWKDINHLTKQALIFEIFHNNNHIYSTRGGKTPEQIEQQNDYKPRLMPISYAYDSRIPLNNNGKLHFIRFIRSDRILRIFSEKFIVNDELVDNYVKATIDIKNKALQIFLNNEIVQVFNYKIA